MFNKGNAAVALTQQRKRNISDIQGQTFGTLTFSKRLECKKDLEAGTSRNSATARLQRHGP